MKTFFQTIEQKDLFRDDLINKCEALGIIKDECENMTFHQLRLNIAIQTIGFEKVDSSEFKLLWISDLVECNKKCKLNHSHLKSDHFVIVDCNEELKKLDIVKNNIDNYFLNQEGSFMLLNSQKTLK